MFTGLVEETGKIQKITSDKIRIQCNLVLSDLKLGDSIAVNGVCLTVTEINSDNFTADVSPETFKVTALCDLKTGVFVNLERALKLQDRLGGHIVTGHIDSRGKCIAIHKDNDFYNLTIQLNDSFEKYAVKKGSITINGISLTIADINKNDITIAIIPHTFENTNLKYMKVGDYVNIETDILAKYVENFLSTGDNKSGIDMDFLQQHGF